MRGKEVETYPLVLVVHDELAESLQPERTQ